MDTLVKLTKCSLPSIKVLLLLKAFKRYFVGMLKNCDEVLHNNRT